VLTNGEWYPVDQGWTLKLGEIFLGRLRQRGGDSIYATCWIATLNGVSLSDSENLTRAKSLVEWEIICQLRHIVPGYRVMVARSKGRL
jgi:hypothetical protein